MKRDMSVTVTRDNPVTSRVTGACDIRDVSRVSHATTTTPHPTCSVLTVVCGVSGSNQIQSHRYLRSPAAPIGLGEIQ